MKERKLLERVRRTHKIAQYKKLEALIVLFDDCIYIKIDILYEDIKCRDTYYDMYISRYEQYLCVKESLLYGNATEKLAWKVVDVLIDWKVNQYFSFSDDNKIVIKGGQKNDK